MLCGCSFRFYKKEVVLMGKGTYAENILMACDSLYVGVISSSLATLDL